MDLMEAEEIKKRWQEYTEELYQKKKKKQKKTDEEILTKQSGDNHRE